MSNPTNPIDFSIPLSTFLSQIVSDGTYGDIIEVKKTDQAGAQALASQIHQAAGELWSNLVDDMFKATWDRQFLARKIWGLADAATRDALGSDDGLLVGDLAWVDALQRLYRAVTVAPSSSTWLPVSGQSGRSVIFDYTFKEFTPVDLKALGDGTQTITDGTNSLDLELFNTANAGVFAVGASGIEVTPSLTADPHDGPGFIAGFAALLGEDWVGRPMTLEAEIELDLEQADDRAVGIGVGTPHSSTDLDNSLFCGIAPQGAAAGLLYEIAGRAGTAAAAKAGPNGRVPFRRALRIDVSTGASTLTLWDSGGFPATAAGWTLVARMGFPLAAADPRDFAVVPPDAAVTESVLGAFFQIAATGAAVVGTNVMRLHRLRLTA